MKTYSEASWEPHYILVGSNLLGLHLKRAMLDHGHGLFNVRILTFLDLAKKILQDAEILRDRLPLPEGYEELSLEASLRDTVPASSVLKELKEKKGFLKALKKYFRLITDQHVPGNDVLEPIAQLHRATYLSKYYHPSDLIIEACTTQQPVSRALQTETLFCYGFYDLTQAQENLLRRCSQDVGLWAWVPAAKAQSASLEATQAFFASLDPSPTRIDHDPPSLEIGLHSYGNPELEADGIATQIRRFSAEDKIPMEAMAVILPEAGLSEIYEDAFQRLGIPYYLSGGKPLREWPEGHGFLRFLDFLSGAWDRSEWIDILRLLTPQVPLDDIGHPSDWDLWTKEWGLSRGSQAALERLSRVPSGEGAKERFAAFLRKWIVDAESMTKAYATWREASQAWASWSETYLEGTRASEAIHDLQLKLIDMEPSGLAPHFENVRHVLKSRIERGSLSVGKFKKESVYLGTAMPVRGVRFDVAFFPHMSDDQYPKKRAQHPWFHMPSVFTDDGRVVYDMLLGQTRRAIVSYPRFGLLHEKLNPSLLVREHSEMRPIVHNPWLPWSHVSEPPWNLEQFQRRSMASLIRKHRNLGSVEPFKEWSGLFESVSQWVEKRLGAAEFTEHDGMLRPGEKSWRRESFSAKNISDFCTCPYQYFLRNVLKLSSYESPEDAFEIRHLDRGNVIHTILFRVFDELKKTSGFPLRPESAAKVRTVLEKHAQQAYAELETTSNVGLRQIWSTQKTWILRDLWQFLSQDFKESLFVPEAFELSFGGQSDRPVSVQLDAQHRIGIHGRMDRVDVSLDKRRLRIIDYKTGDTLRTPADAFDGGRAVQLPMYLWAAREMFPSADLESSEAYLMSTSFLGGFKKVGFEGKVLSARWADFQQILRTVQDLHQNGKFVPNPGKAQEHCRVCEFKPICGESIGRLSEKKSRDPRLLAFYALGEIE